MTLLRIQPDTEWTKEPINIGFEVPLEIAQATRSPLATPDQRGAANLYVLGTAFKAIQKVMERPDLAEFEVDTSVKPWGIGRYFMQETIEEVHMRTVNGQPPKAVGELEQRGLEQWQIMVMGKRKKRLFPLYPEIPGPKEGCDDFDELPESLQQVIQPIHKEAS